MAKRKNIKRSRRKQSIYYSQETLLQSSESPDTIRIVKNKNTSFTEKRSSTERLLHERSPECMLFETQQTNLSYFDELSPEIMPKRRRRKLDLNEDQLEIKNEKVPELTEIKQINSSKENVHTQKEICFPLDKTLSLNDEIKLEMNYCESLQEENDFRRKTSIVSTYDTDTHSLKSNCQLPASYKSKSVQYANFNAELGPQHHEFDHFLDNFRSTTSACESTRRFDDKDEKYYEEWNIQNQRQPTFEIVNEKNSNDDHANRCTENWNECKRIITNLRHLNSFKVRTASQEYTGNLFSKCNKSEETRLLQMSSFYCQTPNSLILANNSNEATNKRPFADTNRIESKNNDRIEYEEIKNNGRIRGRSTTPCSGSPPPAKRCRTTLKFDYGEEEETQQQRVASSTVNNLLRAEKEHDDNEFYPKTTITKTTWSSGTSESPTTSILDLPVVSDSGGCSRCFQEPNRDIEFDKRCVCKNFQQKSIRFSFSRKPITKVTIFWAWLIKKISTALKKSYGNFKRNVLMTSSTRRQMNELRQLVIMLRTENEQMINTFVEKVSHLSEELTQVRASNVTALGALTTEMSAMQDISKKLAGNNEILMLELQRLHKTFEQSRPKSPKMPPPPPPPPMPTNLMSSEPVTATSAPLAPPLPPLPPPPPLPPASSTVVPSPALPVTPTTPSSGRSVRTPSRKCSTPLLNRPTITVEDLLKVTLKKAPQNIKENRRNTIPGPKGPVVSLDMLRSVKLKSARRRTSDQLRSPKSARMIKTRTAPSLSLSPIMTGADNSLGRILKQVDVNRRGPRRLLVSSAPSFRENSITKDNQSQSLYVRDSCP